MDRISKLDSGELPQWQRLTLEAQWVGGKLTVNGGSGWHWNVHFTDRTQPWRNRVTCSPCMSSSQMTAIQEVCHCSVVLQPSENVLLLKKTELNNFEEGQAPVRRAKTVKFGRGTKFSSIHPSIYPSTHLSIFNCLLAWLIQHVVIEPLLCTTHWIRCWGYKREQNRYGLCLPGTYGLLGVIEVINNHKCMITNCEKGLKQRHQYCEKNKRTLDLVWGSGQLPWWRGVWAEIWKREGITWWRVGGQRVSLCKDQL